MNKDLVNLFSQWGTEILFGYALLMSLVCLFQLSHIRHKENRRSRISEILVKRLFLLAAKFQAFAEACESFLLSYREVKGEQETNVSKHPLFRTESLDEERRRIVGIR